MQSHSTRSSVCDLICLKLCWWDLSLLLYIAIVIILFHSIPWYEYIIIYSFCCWWIYSLPIWVNINTAAMKTSCTSFWIICVHCYWSSWAIMHVMPNIEFAKLNANLHAFQQQMIMLFPLFLNFFANTCHPVLIFLSFCGLHCGFNLPLPDTKCTENFFIGLSATWIFLYGELPVHIISLLIFQTSWLVFFLLTFRFSFFFVESFVGCKHVKYVLLLLPFICNGVSTHKCYFQAF